MQVGNDSRWGNKGKERWRAGERGALRLYGRGNAFQWQGGGSDAISTSTDDRESSEVGMRMDPKEWYMSNDRCQGASG